MILGDEAARWDAGGFDRGAGDGHHSRDDHEPERSSVARGRDQDSLAERELVQESLRPVLLGRVRRPAKASELLRERPA